MIAYKFYFILSALIQQVPPPPGATAKSGPTPPGDPVPLDTDIWILLVIAIVMIAYVALPKFKKAS